MGRIVAIAQAKGGVGKSTLAVHLLAWLAERGHNVALLDADPQRSSSLWAAQAVPAAHIEAATDPDAILETIPHLQKRCGFLICDGQAGLPEASRALLLRADLALLPVGPSVLDLRALADAVRLVKQAQSIRAGKPAATVVLNRFQAQRTRIGEEAQEAAGSFGLRVARSIIHNRVAVSDSASQGSVAWLLAGGEAAGAEFNELFEEVIDDGHEAQADVRGTERSRSAVPSRRPTIATTDRTAADDEEDAGEARA